MDEIDAELGEGVVAGDGWMLDYSDVDHGCMFLHVLRGLTLEIGIESGNTAGELGSVVAFFIEQFDFQRACLRSRERNEVGVPELQP